MLKDLISCSLLLSLTALVGCSSLGSYTTTQTEQKHSANTITLENSEIFSVYSAHQQEAYRIRVSLPASYKNNPGKSYPIIIKVDGQWDFPLAASAYNCLYFDGQIPEIVFVGIDWPDVEGNIHAIRSRDLLPSPVSYFAGSGQAKSFIDILEKDLIPSLEQRYRLNGERFLLGGSWGAIFASYALLERPALFSGAIAIAGGYEPFEPAFEALIKQHANTPALAGKRLYLGAGRYDELAPSVLNLAERLQQANLQGLDVRVDYLEGFGHSGMNIPGYAGGYQHMFKRPELQLNATTLASYTGSYISTNQAQPRQLLVGVEKGHLTAASGEGEKTTLLAEAENRFYLPGAFYNLKFEGDQLTLETFFGVEHYRRVD